jgi:hypothetical protein
VAVDGHDVLDGIRQGAGVARGQSPRTQLGVPWPVAATQWIACSDLCTSMGVCDRQGRGRGGRDMGVHITPTAL